MKKLTMLLLYILFTSAAVNAQPEKIFGGAGHFRFGYSNYNMQKINDWLPNRYPQLKNDFITFGGSGYGILGNIIIGGEGYGSIGSTVSRDTLSISPSVGKGMFNLGYVLTYKDHFIIYPMFGIGGGGASFAFEEVESGDGIVNHVKEDKYHLSNSNVLLGLSVGADKFFNSEESNGGFSVSLRVGYVYALQNSNWKKQDVEVSGPDFNLSGFYATLGIGGGGWSTK